MLFITWIQNDSNVCRHHFYVIFLKDMICTIKLNFLFAGEYYADPYFCRLGNNWTLSVYCNFYTSIYRQYIKMLHPVFNHCSIQSSGHKSSWDKIKLYFMSDVYHKHVLRQTWHLINILVLKMCIKEKLSRFLEKPDMYNSYFL